MERNKAQLITRCILTVVYALCGLAVYTFIFITDGNFKTWTKVFYTILLGIVFCTVIALLVLSIKTDRIKSDLVYHLSGGLFISIGISIFAVATFVFGYPSITIAFVVYVPIGVYVINAIVWRLLKVADNDVPDEPVSNRRIFTIGTTAVFAATAVFLTAIAIYASVLYYWYNVFVLALILPILIVPYIGAIRRGALFARPTAYLYGTVIGLTAVPLSVPFMQFPDMDSSLMVIGLVMLCVFAAGLVAVLVKLIKPEKSKGSLQNKSGAQEQVI